MIFKNTYHHPYSWKVSQNSRHKKCTSLNNKGIPVAKKLLMLIQSKMFRSYNILHGKLVTFEEDYQFGKSSSEGFLLLVYHFQWPQYACPCHANISWKVTESQIPRVFESTPSASNAKRTKWKGWSSAWSKFTRYRSYQSAVLYCKPPNYTYCGQRRMISYPLRRL